MVPETIKTHKNKPMILVVEDSPTQALHLQALLEQAGLEVTVATDGQMGLELACDLHPALIILDVELPKMNGLEVCEQLKGAPDTSDIPIIMLTNHGDREAFIVFSQNLGVVDYIVKDAFADAILLEMLRHMGLIGAHTV